MRIVLSNVVAVGALMRLIHVDKPACRHVLLRVDIAITTTCLRLGTECRRVSARQWISECELVFERHPHEQVFVTTPWTTFCHLLHTHTAMLARASVSHTVHIVHSRTHSQPYQLHSVPVSNLS